MKAVVVSPSICDFYFTPGRATALGARSVFNQLIKTGIECELYNLPLMVPRGKKIPTPESLNYLDPYLIPGERGSISFFNTYKRFGPTPEESAQIVLSSDPDIIFISLFAWGYADDALDLAKKIKKQQDTSKKITICIGGAGVAVLPEYFKKTELFDFILTGDAEDLITPLTRVLKEGHGKFSSVPHLYGVNGSSNQISTNNPDPVVSLNRDSRNKQWLSMILSRGCPLKCKFCSNHLTQGRTFRSTEIDKLREELQQLDVSIDHPLHINLEDDNLLIRKRYFENTLLMIKGLYLHATFSIENGLDYTFMTPEYVDFLIDTGFTGFTLSLGSSDLDILKEEERPADLKNFEAILNRLEERRIPVKTFLICGLPGDSKDTILNSLNYLFNLPTDTGISLFYPVPGLPRFEDKDIFLNRSPRLCCGSSAYPWAGSVTTEVMVTAFRLARLSNLIKRVDKSDNEILLIETIMQNMSLFTFRGKSKEIIPIPNMNEYLIHGFLSHIGTL